LLRRMYGPAPVAAVSYLRDVKSICACNTFGPCVLRTICRENIRTSRGPA
jgi:hypothetical protein